MAISNGDPVVVIPGADGLPVAMGSPSAISLGDPVVVIPGADGLPIALTVSAPANGDPTFLAMAADGLPVTLTFGGQCWDEDDVWSPFGVNNLLIFEYTVPSSGQYVFWNWAIYGGNLNPPNGGTLDLLVNDVEVDTTGLINSTITSNTFGVVDVLAGDVLKVLATGNPAGTRRTISRRRFSHASCVRYLWQATYDCRTESYTVSLIDAVYPDGRFYADDPDAWSDGIYDWTYQGDGVYWKTTAPNDTAPAAPTVTPTVYYTWADYYDCYYAEDWWGVALGSCDYSGSVHDWQYNADAAEYEKVTTSSTPPSPPALTPDCNYYWENSYDCSHPGWYVAYLYDASESYEITGWQIEDLGGGYFWAWCVTDTDTPPADPPTPTC